MPFSDCQCVPVALALPHSSCFTAWLPKGSHGSHPQTSLLPEHEPPIYIPWAVAHCWHPVPVSTPGPGQRTPRRSKALAVSLYLRPDAHGPGADVCIKSNLLSVPTCSRRKGTECQQHARQSLLSSFCSITQGKTCSKTEKLKNKAGTKLSFCLHLL